MAGDGRVWRAGGDAAAMSLIEHGWEPGEVHQQQQRSRRRQSSGGSEVARRARERRTGYLLFGLVLMIPGLILYFGGGYLFVAAYNGEFPLVTGVPVNIALQRIFYYLGPVFFFIGLVLFVVAYASFCRGLDSHVDY